MKSEYYLPPALEKSQGIELVDDAGHMRKYKDLLQAKVDDAARLLGAETKEIKLPERGFLRNPLTQEQKAFINTMLTLKISNDNVLQQEHLQKIPIEECNEKMVSLQAIFRSSHLDVSYSRKPFHPACGEWANQKRIWYMRESAVYNLTRVFHVANQLGMRPHLEDAFRPEDVQRGLLLRRIVQVAQEYPKWDALKVLIASKSFTASVPGLAGHQAGAAIDVRFKNMNDGEFFDLGNEYPEGSSIACIDNPYVTAMQFVARGQFMHLMRMGGFKVLDTENWHASHGDRGLGFDSHAHAKSIYGPVRTFDEKTGKVQPWEPDRIEVPYISLPEASQLVELSRMKIEGRDGLVFRDCLEVVDSFRSIQRETGGVSAAG